MLLRTLERVVDDSSSCSDCRTDSETWFDITYKCAAHRPRGPGRPRRVVVPPTPQRYEWELPHHGDALDQCGTFATWAHHAGNGVGHGQRRFYNCGRFECSVCRSKFDEAGNIERAGGWEDTESWAMLERIEYAYDHGYERGRPIHVIFSPEQFLARLWMKTDVGYDRLKKLAYSSMRDVGFRGGVLVFHHQRIPSRWNRRTKCSDGPHFHAIGYGWIDGDAVARLHDQEGHVVVNKGVRDDVRRTALYLLSHASRPRVCSLKGRYQEFDRLAVTWFGSLSYNKMEVVDDVDAGERAIWCGICDKDVPRDDWFEIDLPFGEPPPATDAFFVDLEKCRRVLPETESWEYGPLWRDYIHASRTGGVDVF